MRRLVVVGALVGALLTTACGDKSEPLGPAATLPRGTTTTNPYTVPPVIDEAYVNRVLAGLDQAVGEVVRIVVASRTIPPEAVERLKAIYVGAYLQHTVDGFQDDMFRGFDGYRETPGNQVTTVTRLITIKSSCIFAEVQKDFSPVSVDSDPELSRQWVALVPLASNGDPNGYNPTHWVFTYDGFRQDLSAPPDPCGD